MPAGTLAGMLPTVPLYPHTDVHIVEDWTEALESAELDGSSRCISRCQSQLSLTACHVRYRIALWDNRSIGHPGSPPPNQPTLPGPPCRPS